MTPTPFWIAGLPGRGARKLEVANPWDGSTVGHTTWAEPAQVSAAVYAAAKVADEFAQLPAHRRAAACRHVAQRLEEDAETVAQLITAENGKPIRWARIEVARAASTFTWAAEEARRFSAGQMQRLDTEPAGEGKLALTRRFPYGPVLGITPFNFPLNLVAHKVAPALAVGAPVLLKPAPSTPLSALYLGKILAETDLPEGAFSVLTVPNSEVGELAADPRLPVVSFTGSDAVGWSIKDALPRKHVTLELGGNAAALICEDWSGPGDLEWAAERLAVFGNYQAGQSCISAQRVYVHESLYEEFLTTLTAKVSALGVGDPRNESCVVGPMIDEAAAKRLQEWVDEAVELGATVHVGGSREGSTFAPTVLSGVPAKAKLATEEAFGPVLTVESKPSLPSGLRAINDSRFGLQAGVFTRLLEVAAQAHRSLHVGGVVIGDVPSFRADHMPYGGTKASGVGREGVASAMEDYTEPRVMVLPDMM